MDSIYTQPKTYNTDELYRILKHNEDRIQSCTAEFVTLCGDALRLCHQAMQSHQYEQFRRGFHNLLNICKFFGAVELFDLIQELKDPINTRKEITLCLLEAELRNVISHFGQQPGAESPTQSASSSY